MQNEEAEKEKRELEGQETKQGKEEEKVGRNEEKYIETGKKDTEKEEEGRGDLFNAIKDDFK